MNTKEWNGLLAKYLSGAKVFFGVTTVLLLIFFVIGEIVFPDERDTLKTECREFQVEWQRVMENGERIPVEVPGKLEAERGEVVTLVTTIPEDVCSGETLDFRPVWQDVTVYIDGELRQKYTTENSRPFGTNSAFRHVFVDLYDTDVGKELMYQFSSDSKYAGHVRVGLIGDRTSIWVHYIHESGIKTMVSVFLLLLSVFCIIVGGVLKFVYKRKLALNYLAWTLFFAALWMLSETEFRQLLFKNVSSLTNYTYWSLMIIPIPLLVYMDEIQKGHHRKLYLVPITYSSVVLVVGTLLQVFEVVQFVQQLPVIHGGLIIATISIFLTIGIDVAKKRFRDYFFVGIGIFGMVFSTVWEIVFYYKDVDFSLGTFLSVGLLFLLIMAIIKTGQDLFNLERKKQQAIMAREAQAKFLANMSHEIRTPINAVIGMNEMILRECQTESVREYAHNIQSSSNMLLGLVSDVLDFSKVESGQLELVEGAYQLATLLNDEKLLLDARATGKPIKTYIEVDSNVPAKLYGDELRVKQVLTNLLSNAVKYTREGSVTLKATSEWISDEMIELQFAVVDTGIGIRESDLSQLFDSFKRLELNLNRNIEGTGLGLNIAKGLVDLMGGNIQVESKYGEGSTFIVSIPQKVLDKRPIGVFEDALRETRKEVEATMGTNSFTAPDANILIVDDNSINLSVMKGLLKRTEIKADFATGGYQCLEITKQKKYDIIFMDHMMPELDGVETLQLLKEDDANQNRHTIVIALTANAIAGSREMYLEYGFDDYFSKPIQADKLDEIIVKYLPKELVKFN